jgi:hypothetical protein
MVPPHAEDVPAAATVAEALITPPPPVPVTGVEEVGTIAEASTPRAVMGASDTAGPGGEDAVAVMDEGLAAPLSSESRDVVIPSAPGAMQVAMATSSLPAVKVPGPSPVAEASGPPPTTEVADTSSDQITLTTEEVMELATCRYINFPSVGVIDLEGPQYSEKGYEATEEWMSNAPTIRETLASVSKALQEYESADGFSLASRVEDADAALVAPVGLAEPTVGASVPLAVDEDLEAPPPQPAETTDAPVSVAGAGASEAIVGEEASSPPRLVVAYTESVDVRIPDELTTVTQGPITPETATRAASPEIQEVEEAGASLIQGVAGDEARTLELECVSWAASSGLSADSEDDEEAMTRNTLERGMTWARRTFDELILPATSVSFLVRGQLLNPVIFSGCVTYPYLVGCRSSSLLVGDMPVRCGNFALSGPNWRCSSSWPKLRRLVL